MERGGERSRVPETPGAGLREEAMPGGEPFPDPSPPGLRLLHPSSSPEALCVLHVLVGRVDLTLLSLVVSLC